MAQAVVLRELGGPENLKLETVADNEAADDRILVRNLAIGVNFIDTYFRRGLYPTTLPAVLGDQGVGVVEACGTDVHGISVGDHVAFASVFGAYIDCRWMDPSRVVVMPKSLDIEQVAGSLTRGLTAEYLLFRLHQLGAGQTAVIHAAAGGTGMVMCQWAKVLGARVIGTVGAATKIERARELGCDLVLRHDDAEFVDKVRDFTDGVMADVVYDSIGKSTFSTSLQCLRPRGLMVAFGNASGKPDPLDVLELARLGSLYLTRPSLSHYIGTREELELSAERYFSALRSKQIRAPETTRFALADAVAAHRHLEDRSTLTVPILVP